MIMPPLNAYPRVPIERIATLCLAGGWQSAALWHQNDGMATRARKEVKQKLMGMINGLSAGLLGERMVQKPLDLPPRALSSNHTLHLLCSV